MKPRTDAKYLLLWKAGGSEPKIEGRVEKLLKRKTEANGRISSIMTKKPAVAQLRGGEWMEMYHNHFYFDFFCGIGAVRLSAAFFSRLAV